jgi:hypothetical protein
VLFAASCILISLHPSYVASSLIEGNRDISTGLEWIRTWALQVAEADPDTECTSVSTVIITGISICYISIITYICTYIFYYVALILGI